MCWGRRRAGRGRERRGKRRSGDRGGGGGGEGGRCRGAGARRLDRHDRRGQKTRLDRSDGAPRSEEHTSELQSLMRISNDGFCLKKNKTCKYIGNEAMTTHTL